MVELACSMSAVKVYNETHTQSPNHISSPIVLLHVHSGRIGSSIDIVSVYDVNHQVTTTCTAEYMSH